MRRREQSLRKKLRHELMAIERIITAILNEEVEIFYQGARVTISDLDELQDRRHRIHKLLSQKWQRRDDMGCNARICQINKAYKKRNCI